MSRRMPLLGAVMALAAAGASVNPADRIAVQRFMSGYRWGEGLFAPRHNGGSRARKLAKRFARTRGRRGK